MWRIVVQFVAIFLVCFASGAQAQLPLPLSNPDLDLRHGVPGRAALALGDGGAIIAGDFRFLAGTNQARLAKVLANGSVDPSWAPAIDGGINEMLRDGDRLFLFGSFSSVNNTPRRGMAELSISSGALASWDPNAGSNSSYDFLGAARIGNHFYVGGRFTQVGTSPRSNLAKIDVASGQLDATWVPSADGNSRVGTDGTAVFLGGEFTQINGTARSRAAKLDTSTGALAAWAPQFNSVILDVGVDGGFFYATGCFNAVGGTARNFMARVDSNTGLLDSTWNPAPNGGCTIYLDVTSTHVYFSGPFSMSGGQPALTIARVSKTGTGANDTSFAPQLDGGTFGYGSIETSANTVLLYGEFQTVGGSYSPGVALVSRSNGALTTALASEDRGVALALLPTADGGTLVGGRFSRVANDGVGSNLRRGLLKLNASGQLDTSFTISAKGTVFSLAALDTSIYVGGDFNRLGSTAINNLARLNASFAVDVGWTPNPSGAVAAISPDSSAQTLLVGGNFTSIAGQPRNRVAEVRNSAPTVTAWNPDANGFVWALSNDGSNVFVGGDFGQIGGVARVRLAKVSRATGALDTGFSADANNGVRALMAGPSNTLYVGGFFGTIGSLGRPGFGRLLRSTGAPDPSWSTFLSGGHVLGLAPAADGGFYTSGNFSTIGNVARQSLARLNHSGGVDPLFAPLASFGLYAVLEQGSRVTVGGDVNYFAVAGTTRIGIQAFPLNATPVTTVATITSDAPENSQPFQSYRVAVNVIGSGNLPAANQSVLIEDDRGAACTAFLDTAGNGACELASRFAGNRTLTARFAGTPLLLASVDTELHAVSGISSTPPVNPAFDLRSASPPSASVTLSDGSIVIGGSFTRVGNQPRRGLARIRTDGTVDPNFSADVIGSVSGLTRDTSDNIYVVGFFGYIDGVLRRNVAKLDVSGNVVQSWTAGDTNISGGNGSQAVDSSGDLYFSGLVQFVSGSPNVTRTRVVKLSGSTGSVITTFATEVALNGNFSSSGVGLTVDGSSLYLYRQFDAVNGSPVRNLARVSTTTGVLDTTFLPNPDQRVDTLESDGAGGNYVGGAFTQIAGQTRSFAARLGSGGALVTAFNPAPNSTVQRFLRRDGMLFAQGFFNVIGGQSSGTFSKLDPASGALDASFAPSTSVDYQPQLTALGSSFWAPCFTTQLGASDVISLGAVRVNGLTGAQLATDLISRPARVSSLARQPDGATLLGGNFVRIGSVQRNLVRISAGGQYDTGFSPAITVTSGVNAIKVLGSGSIYAAVSSRVLKLSSAGVIDPAFGVSGVSSSNTISSLGVASDGLLAGGSFSTLGGVGRIGVGKLDFATGAVLPWNPVLSASSSIRTIEVDPAGNAFIGGEFTTVNGTAKQRLAKLNSAGALENGFTANADSRVNTLLLVGNDLYAGGFFGAINGTTRRGLAKVSGSTGAVAAWDPAGDRFVTPNALAVAQDGGILVGGSFSFLGGAFRSNAAKIDPLSGLADANWNPSFDATVRAILPGYGDTPPAIRLPHIEQNISFGGDFEFAGAVEMPGFTAVSSQGALPERMFCSNFEDNGCAPLP